MNRERGRAVVRCHCEQGRIVSQNHTGGRRGAGNLLAFSLDESVWGEKRKEDNAR